MTRSAVGETVICYGWGIRAPDPWSQFKGVDLKKDAVMVRKTEALCQVLAHDISPNKNKGIYLIQLFFRGIHSMCLKKKKKNQQLPMNYRLTVEKVENTNKQKRKF